MSQPIFESPNKHQDSSQNAFLRKAEDRNIAAALLKVVPQGRSFEKCFESFSGRKLTVPRKDEKTEGILLGFEVKGLETHIFPKVLK